MEIKINTEKKDYSPGEILSGKIIIIPNSPIIINKISIELVLTEIWKQDNNNSDNNTQQISKFDIDIHKVLDKPKNSIIKLEKKNYEFLFKLLLPDYLLPSFEYPGEEYKAYLRYSLNVKITTQDSNFSESLLININAIPKKDENNLNMESSIDVKTWGFLSQGKAIFRASYPTKNYTFSDVIPIEVEIDNTSSCLAVTECKLRFLRKIIFKNIENFSEVYNKVEELLIDIHTIMVKSNEKKKYYYNLNLQNINFNKYTFENPYKNDKQLSDLMPSLDGSIIICQYSVLVRLNYESYVTDYYRPRFDMPIYIINALDANKGQDNNIKSYQSNIDKNSLKLDNIIDDDNYSLPSKSLLLNIEREKNKEKEKEKTNEIKNKDNMNNNNKEMITENKINNNIININYSYLNELNKKNDDYEDDEDNDLPSKSTIIRLKKEKKEKEEKEKEEKREEEEKNNIINSINNKQKNYSEYNKENNNNFLINNNNFYPDLDSNDINNNDDKDNVDLRQTMKILLNNNTFQSSLKNNNK